MKILNRPMFRYGGPIKEGIMDGIKEPRQGYQQSGMVFPGDAKRMMPNASKVFADVSKTYAPPNWYRDVNEPPIGGSHPVNTKIKKPIKPSQEMDLAEIGGYGEIEKPYIDYEKIPKYIDDIDGDGIRDLNPEYTKNKSFIHDIFSGPYKSITDERFEAPITVSNTNIQKDKIGLPHNLTQDAGASNIDEVIKEKDTVIDTEGNRKKSINNILEKLGYARSKKNALYDALIAGGERISREGLGKTNLVADLIKDTSTAYEKPEKIREAAELMQVQQDLKLEGIDRSKDNRGTVQKTIEYFMSKDGGDHSRADALALSKNQAIDAHGIFTEAKAKGTTTEAVDFTASKMAKAGRFGEGNVYKNRIDTKYKGSSGLIEFMESGSYNGDGVYTRGGEILLLKDGKVTSLVRFKGTGKTGFFGGEKE